MYYKIKRFSLSHPLLPASVIFSTCKYLFFGRTCSSLPQRTGNCFFIAVNGGELLNKMNALPLVDLSSHERSKSNHKKIAVRKNSLHSLPRPPGQLIQRLNMLARISRHHCALTWDGACGWVWQVSEASRPPSSRISFSFGWWTVSNSTSFGRSGDTDANFCRRHGEQRHNTRL